MFKVTEDVSCCTDKCMQALEALYFLLDMVQTFCTLIQPKFENKFNILLNFQLLTRLSNSLMSNETRFSISFWKECGSTVEPWFNEDPSITNDFHGLSNSKLYWKQPWYNKTLL